MHVLYTREYLHKVYLEIIEMSSIEQYGAKSLDSEVLIHSNLNEQTTRLYNKKRTVHHLCDYESSSHTSKCNRMKLLVQMAQHSNFLLIPMKISKKLLKQHRQ